MDLIAAVYEDWGIGRNGSQPVVLKADRKFFNKMTMGKIVVAGYNTILDFPDKKPLPGRINIVLSKGRNSVPGFLVANNTDCIMDIDKLFPGEVMIIGGAQVFSSFLADCDRAYITKIQTNEKSDRKLHNLDESKYWEVEKVLEKGVENGLRYEIIAYRRIKDRKGG